MPVYRLYQPKQQPRLGLYVHDKGHNMTPESQKRMEQWVKTYV